jgi:hypothetical protein
MSGVANKVLSEDPSDASTGSLPQVVESRANAPEGPLFESEATQVLQRLRTALADVISALPGPVSKPAELQRTLKIDMKLSCKIFKVVSASGSLAAGPHVPGLGALRTFLTAARKAGVGAQLIDAVMEAAARFNHLVVSHAGDRTAFDSMISSFVGSDDAAQITLQHRRAAFRAQRHIFGVEARLQIQCVLMQPSHDARMLDFARISGFLALRQLRPGAPLIVSEACATNDDGTIRAVEREPLDPTTDPAYGLALVQGFCSRPLPQFRAVKTGPRTFRNILVSNGVGKKAATTYFEGHVARGIVPRYREEENRYGAVSAGVRMPCEGLLLDLLVHENTFGPLTPIAYAEHWSEVKEAGECEEWLRLEPRESVAYLGKGPSVLYAADVPRYADLGRYAFERLGWDGEHFDVYRCRVDYPIVPSTVVMHFDLPAEPAAQ